MQCNIDKAAIRIQMKQARKNLTKTEIKDKSRAICTAFAAIDEFLKANTVCVYMSAFNEVDTSFIIEECKRHKKTVVVPVVDGDDIYLSRLGDKLKKGAFGISEPTTKAEFPAEEVDIFAVPALAYDKFGGRVGFGKGYYDKLLKNSCGLKVGLCYDFQLVDKIPTESHDILMDFVITEFNTINCRKDL